MRRRMIAAVVTGLMGLAVLGAPAVDAATRHGLTIERAWARATPPGTAVGAVYLVIRNPGRHSDRLLAASTPRADRVEFHKTIRDVDIVRMQRVVPVHVAANSTVTLEPGGLHAMLFGLKKPLRDGDRFPMTLSFERAGRQQLEVRVVAVDAVETAHPHH